MSPSLGAGAARMARVGGAIAPMALVASAVLALALPWRAAFALPQVATVSQPRAASPTRFPHDKHAKVFPVCTSCHAGVVDPGQSMWPTAQGCASCHDGTVKPRITWEPRVGPRAGNRRFTHEAHGKAAAARNPADSAMMRNCAGCHTEPGAPRMAVRNAVVGNCLQCHGLKAPHVDNGNEVCATCHVRLTDAPSLTREWIKTFPKPQSHAAADFVLGGHGRAAKVPGRLPGEHPTVAASCATCHSRNLCMSCHVNAAESPVILSLALDDRPPVYTGTQPVPPTHRAAGWLGFHGRDAERSTATCSSCHSRESCFSCHVGIPPRAVTTMPTAGPGRAPGAHLKRVPPASHTSDFKERHGPQASARPATCESCHLRSTCLECHRPEGSRQARYHAQGFLTRHPASAYSREMNCSECHNPAQFCQACHQQSGLVARRRIGRTGYHDAFRGFSLGHGQAARQSLESCASCHAERDCTACHSAVGGGYRFNPHGPGFNAATAKAKNPSVCVACHGRAIPGG
ncbi:MAG: hypothetical protein HYX65_02380 [Gemmatimonadetes bacterium]|nr:hypothetical protein [Gemmatimonadota bacterium]